MLDNTPNNTAIPKDVISLSGDVPLLAFFFGYFCPHSRDIIILLCCPAHLRKEVLKELKEDSRIKFSEGTSTKLLLPLQDMAVVYLLGGVRANEPKDLEDFFLM